MPKIKGGYILQPRAIDDAWIAKSPPHIREIWLYLLRKANHADCPKYKLKRGQLRTSYREIIDDLSWTVGYRKESYKRTNCETAMRALTREGMITTSKSIRGMVITICKYDFYQNPKNYEVDTEVDNEVDNENINESTRYTRRIKNDKNETSNTSSNLPFSDFWDLYDKKVGSKKKLEKKWEKISEEDRTKIREYIPRYKKSQPDKMFRKNPETFLNNESWNDEIINENKNINYGKDRRDSEAADRERQIMQLAREAGMA